MENNEEVKDKNKKIFLKKRFIVPSILIAGIFTLGFHAFIESFTYQTTDDAFVAGHMSAVAPKVSGQILKVYFDDNYTVHKGQLLAEIDSRDFQNKVNELEGALAEAKANKKVSNSDIGFATANLSEAGKTVESAKSKLSVALRDYNRYKDLKSQGLCTKQQYDSAKTKFDVANSEYKETLAKTSAMSSNVKSTSAKSEASSANIEKLQAQLAQAKLNLTYKKIYAPQDGTISSKTVEPGNFVQVGQPITAVVSRKIWVVANFKETQLTHMQVGQPVIVKIDTFPGKKFRAHVDSIQRASGAQASLFPPENAVGSYVKVVQRIPVKIVFDKNYSEFNIVPGMSVVPKVKIR